MIITFHIKIQKPVKYPHIVNPTFMQSFLSKILRPLRELKGNFLASKGKNVIKQKIKIHYPKYLLITANLIVFNYFIYSYYWGNKGNPFRVHMTLDKVNDLHQREKPNHSQDSNNSGGEGAAGQRQSEEKNGKQNKQIKNKQSKDTEEKKKKSRQLFIIPQDIKKVINKSKMILVMDLDQTMVFTRRKRPPKHGNYAALNICEKIIYVEHRPHLAEFLHAVSQMFTVYVYTAGTKIYADAVLDSIPGSHVIQKRFYRQSCIQHQGNLIKDLKVIRNSFQQAHASEHPHPTPNHKQKLTILVDDNSLSISFNAPHSVRVRAFQGSQQDKYLQQVFKRLVDYYREHCYDKNQAPKNEDMDKKAR